MDVIRLFLVVHCWIVSSLQLFDLHIFLCVPLQKVAQVMIYDPKVDRKSLVCLKACGS